MGTRAQFFVGDPEKLTERKWLGCVAWDGYPDSFPGLAPCKTEEEFTAAVRAIALTRDDFCDPAKHGFPFPWTKNLFLTDYTYALIGSHVLMTRFDRGWISLTDYLRDAKTRNSYDAGDLDSLPDNVPAPTEKWDRSAPDSIMIISRP